MLVVEYNIRSPGMTQYILRKRSLFQEKAVLLVVQWLGVAAAMPWLAVRLSPC